ncbi:MAG: ferrous iron transporter B, partial [Erysipelotrichia bacterium]|nr:ferrous iron transporter B [Erysipelotrichia bacterium]
SVVILMWEKAKDFIERAFSVILVATVIIWFLQTFDTRLNVVMDNSTSLLAALGRVFSPIFKPLGFTDWRITTALITGFTAKEAVVSTLGVLLDTSTAGLTVALSALFTPASALSFLTFTLQYSPCVAAIAAIRRELGNLHQTLLMILFQCTVAWVIALLVYRAALLFFV